MAKPSMMTIAAMEKKVKKILTCSSVAIKKGAVAAPRQRKLPNIVVITPRCPRDDTAVATVSNIGKSSPALIPSSTRLGQIKGVL